jgi:hypothetical protein
MAVLKALRQTPSTLQRNPILFVPVLVILLFQIPQLVLRAVNPLVASIVSMVLSLVFIFVMPFFQAGIVGMADEALDSFLREGKSNYVSVLAASLVLVAVNFVLGFVAFFVAIFGGFAILSDTGVGIGIVGLVIIGLIGALVVLAYLLFVFFVQFYSQAIVVDDLGAVDGLKHSISVVRHHLVSTLGYSVLVGILGGIAGGVFGIASLLSSPQSTSALALPEVSLAGVVGVTLLVIAFGTLFGGFFGVYSVAFYRTINPGVTDGA